MVFRVQVLITIAKIHNRTKKAFWSNDVIETYDKALDK